MKKLKMRGHCPAGAALSVVFLITALILFLLTLSVKEEKAQETQSTKRVTTEIILSGGEGWAVHFGGYESAQEARIAGARYVRRGAGGCVIEKDGVYYAAGNLYESMEEAMRMEKRLTDEGFTAGVLSLSAQDALLKVTAEEEKIRLLSEGYQAYLSAEKELLSLSERLDAGKADFSEAMLMVSVLRFDMKAVKEAIKALGEEGVPGKIRSLFEDAVFETDAINETAGGEMLLSARLKCAAICMRERRYEFLNAL